MFTTSSNTVQKTASRVFPDQHSRAAFPNSSTTVIIGRAGAGSDQGVKHVDTDEWLFFHGENHGHNWIWLVVYLPLWKMMEFVRWLWDTMGSGNTAASPLKIPQGWRWDHSRKALCKSNNAYLKEQRGQVNQGTLDIMVSPTKITQFPRNSQNSTSQSLWFPKNQWIETTANSAWFRCCSGAGIELCSTSPLHGTDFEPPPFQWIQMENIWMEQLNGNNMWMDSLWYTMVIYDVFFMAKLIQRLLSWHLPCSISQTLN